MKRWTLLFLILFSNPAISAELAGIRSLQSGPIGQGFPTSELRHSQTEAILGVGQAIGSESSGNNRMTTSRSKNTLSLASGLKISEEVKFLVQGDLLFHNFKGNSNSLSEYDASSQHSITTLSVGPSYKSKGIILGSHVSLISFGEEKKKIFVWGSTTNHKIDPVVVPIISGFMGVSFGVLDVVLGAKTFNAARTTVESSNPTSQNYKYDTLRTVPGEFNLDFKLNVTQHLHLATGFSVITTERASIAANEYTLDFNPDDPASRSKGEKRDVDHIKIDVGGVLRAQPWISFFGGIHYEEAQYAKSEYASLEYENSGGYTLNVGSNFYSTIGKIYFDLAYQVSEKAKYSKTIENDEDWIRSNNDITLEQNNWFLQLGTTLYL